VSAGIRLQICETENQVDGGTAGRGPATGGPCRMVAAALGLEPNGFQQTCWPDAWAREGPHGDTSPILPASFDGVSTAYQARTCLVLSRTSHVDHDPHGWYETGTRQVRAWYAVDTPSNHVATWPEPGLLTGFAENPATGVSMVLMPTCSKYGDVVFLRKPRVLPPGAGS